MLIPFYKIDRSSLSCIRIQRHPDVYSKWSFVVFWVPMGGCTVFELKEVIVLRQLCNCNVWFEYPIIQMWLDSYTMFDVSMVSLSVVWSNETGRMVFKFLCNNITSNKLCKKLQYTFLAHSLTLSLSPFKGWDFLGLLTWIFLVSLVSSAAVDAFLGPFQLCVVEHKFTAWTIFCSVSYPFTTFYHALWCMELQLSVPALFSLRVNSPLASLLLANSIFPSQAIGMSMPRSVVRSASSPPHKAGSQTYSSPHVNSNDSQQTIYNLQPARNVFYEMCFIKKEAQGPTQPSSFE